MELKSVYDINYAQRKILTRWKLGVWRYQLSFVLVNYKGVTHLSISIPFQLNEIEEKMHEEKEK